MKKNFKNNIWSQILISVIRSVIFLSFKKFPNISDDEFVLLW